MPNPVRVLAQAHAFIPERLDPATGQPMRVGTPDNVQVLTVLQCGARGLYQRGEVRPGRACDLADLHNSQLLFHRPFLVHQNAISSDSTRFFSHGVGA